MTTDLTLMNEVKNLNLQTDALLDKSNKFLQIFTRAGDPGAHFLVEFKIFNETKLAKMAERMPEINRATNVFGKQNSQATSKLMSLNMISQSPYRRLKQCLAQIERKRQALKENIFKLRKEKIAMDRLIYERDDLVNKLNDDSEQWTAEQKTYFRFDLENKIIEIEEKVSNISDSNIYIEGALKEIGMYQDSYDEIKTSYNIPDNWDENDFEKSEVEEHVKTAFLHLVRDVEMTGRPNVGTEEYLFQWGINPTTAYRLVLQYLDGVNKVVDGGNLPSIQMLYDFLDRMYNMFKEEYKNSLKSLGLKTLISEEYLFLDNKNLENISEVE